MPMVMPVRDLSSRPVRPVDPPCSFRRNFPSPSQSSLGGLCTLACALIDAAFCNPRQQLIRVRLLLQGVTEEFNNLVLAEKFCPGPQRSVTRNLIVLGCLRGGQDAGIAHGTVLDFIDDMLALGDDAQHGRADLATRHLSDRLKYLLKSLQVLLGLVAIVGKCLL